MNSSSCCGEHPSRNQSIFGSAVVYILLASSVILIAGLWSGGVWLGDEVHHYRFAENYFWLGHRPVIDVVYSTGNPPGFYYTSDLLWPLGLSLIWKMTGRISFMAAQIYHVFFYALLLLSVYGVARKWYGEKEAFWSLFLTATAPMMASFGMLFYTDVPAAALAVFSFWLLIERRYAGFAAALALQFLMKRSMIFFAPAYFLILFLQNRDRKLKTAVLMVLSAAPLLTVMIWDARWQAAHFPSYSSMFSQLLGRIPGVHQAPAVLKREAIAQFSNSNILSLKDLASYYGILLVPAFAASFWEVRKNDLPLWMLMLPFAAVTWGLGLYPDIRYMLPLTPFLAVLAAKGIVRFVKNKSAVLVILLLGIAQLGAAAGYTAFQRKPPAELLEGFQYIRENLPPKAWVLYPEFNIVEYAERPVVWGNVDLGLLFTGSEEEKKAALHQAGTSYLAVKKSRVYEDAGMMVKHYGGYPASFVLWLNQSPNMKKLFENSQISIWETIPQSASAAGQKEKA